MTKMDEVLRREWVMFQQVNNIGGRASCQDDRDTFMAMRRSQLRAWSPEMVACYAEDLARAEEQERNLLSEKYAYMMARTAPEEFAKISHLLPPLTEEKGGLIRRICMVQLDWYKECVRRWPAVSGRGRSVQEDDDGTSFGTYLFGELATYSMQTLRAYWGYVETLLEDGKNMHAMVLENTVELYGWADLEAAERELSGRS